MNIQEKKEQWEKRKVEIEQKEQLKQEKKNFFSKYKREKISTTKKLIYFLFINCSLIEIFTGWVTYLSVMKSETPDFSPLVALIGAVVGEVISFAIYGIKSVKENTAGGVVFETAMQKQKDPLKEKENNNA